jgi:hypothetical protein
LLVAGHPRESLYFQKERAHDSFYGLLCGCQPVKWSFCGKLIDQTSRRFFRRKDKDYIPGRSGLRLLARRQSKRELAMTRRALKNAASALWAILGVSPLRADPGLPEYIVPSIALPVERVTISQEPYSVLTMAPDGSWGVATSIFIGEAITRAMANCRWMSGPKLGCGYTWKAIQAGWVLGFRCGSDNILVADKIFANAELAALNRGIERRQVYARNMAPCVRVVTVDPDGHVVGSRKRLATPKLEQNGVIPK